MQGSDPQTSSPAASILPGARASALPAVKGRLRLSPARKQQLRALCAFLDDDSPVVWAEIRQQFRAAGRSALPVLRRATHSPDPKVRARARRLLLENARRACYRRLCVFCATQPPDLERTLFLLARWADPDLDVRPWRAKLDALARDVQKLMAERNQELSKAGALADVLGRQMGFGGSVAEFHHPDNIHLHRALARRRGMPLTLSAIYHLVARRAGLRTALLPLPGHVMLRLYGGTQNLILDPYERGRTRTERELRAYLEANGMRYQASWFQDASDALIVRRQLFNLQKSAALRGRPAEAREVQTLLLLLDQNPHAATKAV